MEEFAKLYKKKKNTEKFWVVKIKDLEENSLDLSPKNPNTSEEAPLKSQSEILKEMVID